MKKFIALMLAMVLTAALFVGCSKSNTDGSDQGEGKKTDSSQEEVSKEEQLPANFNPTGFPIVKEKITLKMMGPKAAIQVPWDQMDVFKKMEELTNIHFEFDTPPAENYAEKKNLAFASGELPDVFFGRGSVTLEDETTYGAQGVLISLESLIDKYAPNLKKLFEQMPTIRRVITAVDGHIYSLPSGTDLPMNLTTKIWINQKWLDALGLKMPNTTDELYEVLKAFKANDPNGNGKADEIPMSSVKMNDIRGGMLAAFGFVSARFDVKDGKVIYVPMDPAYKEYLAYMNRLYREGLLDNETFSQTEQALTAKGNEGKVGVFTHAGPFLVVKVEENNSYPALPPLTSNVNNKKIWPKNYEVGTTAFAITNMNKYPEATMRWVDYLYSEEGAVLFHNGVEGKHWRWVDVNGEKQWERITPPDKANPEEWRATATPNCGTGTPEIWFKSFAEKQKDPLNAFIRKEVAEKYEPYFTYVFPPVRFTTEEQKQVTAIVSDLESYVSQMEAKFITGVEPLTNWDNYVDTIKKMNVEQLLKLYQTAYDRWNSIK
ncbi:MAG: extracellular solute-binding protein [Firmicutes bacterium]|nr:extracellular solute-binding protein [Bacillota bacterium]